MKKGDILKSKYGHIPLLIVMVLEDLACVIPVNRNDRVTHYADGVDVIDPVEWYLISDLLEQGYEVSAQTRKDENASI
jgi:hypothetical protein